MWRQQKALAQLDYSAKYFPRSTTPTAELATGATHLDFEKHPATQYST